MQFPSALLGGLLFLSSADRRKAIFQGHVFPALLFGKEERAVSLGGNESESRKTLKDRMGEKDGAEQSAG